MNPQIKTRPKAVRLDRNAFQIAVIYLLIGGLWIFFSDRIAAAIANNESTLTTLSTYKGWFYVLVTGLVLYWLIHRNNSRIQKDNEEIQTAEKNYKHIFDNASVGIYHSTPDGRLLTVNPELASIFGYDSPEEMLASISDIGSQVYKEPTRRKEYQETINEQGIIKEFVNEERRKDGSWIWTSTTARAVKDDVGQILYYEGFTIDVTERKQAEQTLANAEFKYRSLVEQIPFVIYDKSTYISPQIEKFTGYSQDEWLADDDLWVKSLHPEDRQRAVEANEKALNTTRKYASEYRMITKDGRTIWVHDEGQVLSTPSDSQMQTQGIWQDITERKQIEEKLQESEKRFRTLYENSTLGLYRTTPDGKILLANPALIQMLGYSSFEELAQRDLEQEGYEPGYERSEFQIQIERDGQVRGLESSWKKNDGTAIFVRESAKVIRGPDGQVLYYEGSVEDITERKQAEELLRQNEKKYRLLFDNAPVGILLADTKGQIINLNSASLVILRSFTAEATENINILSFQPWIEAGISAYFQRVIDTAQPIQGEFHYINKWDKAIDILVWLTPIYGVKGNVEQIQIIVEDITERKQAEEAVAKERNLLITLIDNLPDRIYFKDIQGRKIVSNAADWKVSGGKRMEDVIGKTDFEIYPAELATRFWADDRMVLDSGKPIINREEPSLDWQGNPIWTLTTKIPLRDDSGQIVGLVGIGYDITERKQINESLRQSEERFRTFVEQSSDGVVLVDEQGLVAEWNLAEAEITGIPRTRAIGTPFWEIQFKLLVPEHRSGRSPEYFKNLMQDVFRIGESPQFGKVVQIEIQSMTGERKILTQASFPIKTANGYRMGSIVRDVTEQRKAENKSREDERQLRALVTSLDDIVFEIDEHGTYLNVWTANESLLARPKAEMLGRRIQDLLPKKIVQRIDESISRVLDSGKVEEVDYPLNLPSGQHWFLARISPIFSTGAPNKTLSLLVRDITQRKIDEENNRLRLAELELVHQSGLELTQGLEPEQIAKRIINQMDKHLDWHHSAIRLYDEKSQTLKILGFTLQGLMDQEERQGLEAHFNSVIQKPGDGLAGWAFQHDQTLRIGDLKLDPRYVETFPGLNSGLYVPIKTDSRTLGVITVENESSDAFSESDEKLINTLANQAAIALENSRLNKETAQQLKQLQALHAIDLAITNSLDLNVTLNLLLDHIIEQLSVDAAAIFLLQPDVNRLKYVMSRGFHTSLLENSGQGFSMNESHAGRAILEHRSVESEAPQGSKGDLVELWAVEGFRSIHVVPLVTKGEAKGAIEVFSRSGNKAIEADRISFLETLADQAAIAIENIQLFERLQKSNMELAIAYDATIEGWSRAMDLRDEETEGHTQRVVEKAMKLAVDFDFSGEMLMHIRRGALLHDIGKLGVPDNILLKPGKLTDEEWVIMKRHPTFAFEMLAPIQYLSRALNIPYCHHEKWDGTGYPRGLSGEQIPLEARIFAIVDVWDALTSDRPYRKAWTKERTLEYIQSLASTHFDPVVVERFLEMQKKESLPKQ